MKMKSKKGAMDIGIKKLIGIIIAAVFMLVLLGYYMGLGEKMGELLQGLFSLFGISG